MEDKPHPKSVLKEMKFDFDAPEAEKQVLPLLQQLRTDPTSFVPHLEARLATFEGNYYMNHGKKIRSREGAPAVQEAIDWLKKQAPLAAWDETKIPLFTAAKDHCVDLCTNSHHGHKGTDGSTIAKRVERHGKWKGGVTENVALQQPTPLDIVIHWIVDDGAKKRIQRQNLMNPKYKCIGIACGVHKKYKSCCVMVLAHNIIEGKGKEAVHLMNEYDKSGYDQFGVNNQVFNFKKMQKTLIKDMRGDLNRDWIPGAVSMRTVKAVEKDEEGNEKTVYNFIYTMGDGSLQTVTRDFDEVMANKADDRAYDGELNEN
jgi:uncharacterized protein YkwD